MYEIIMRKDGKEYRDVVRLTAWQFGQYVARLICAGYDVTTKEIKEEEKC